MVIMIWLQAGFAMVLLSAAIKNVPTDTIEAAKVDGATELEIFWRVTVPQIRSTIVVVGTTILILVLKIFDIVYVMTNGNYGTDVIANLFIREMFNFGQFGRAAVLVVFLIAVATPVHGHQHPPVPRAGGDAMSPHRTCSPGPGGRAMSQTHATPAADVDRRRRARPASPRAPTSERRLVARPGRPARIITWSGRSRPSAC
jgi:hypothetical protein